MSNNIIKIIKNIKKIINDNNDIEFIKIMEDNKNKLIDFDYNKIIEIILNKYITLNIDNDNDKLFNMIEYIINNVDQILSYKNALLKLQNVKIILELVNKYPNIYTVQQYEYLLQDVISFNNIELFTIILQHIDINSITNNYMLYIGSNLKLYPIYIKYIEDKYLINNNYKLLNDVIINLIDIKSYIDTRLEQNIGILGNNREISENDYIINDFFVDNIINLINKYYKYINHNIYLEIYEWSNTEHIYKIFETMLGIEELPEVVFNIIEKNPKFAIQLAQITLSDPDYHIYITKYLNLLLSLNSFDIKELNEKANYYLAKVILEKGQLTKHNKKDIIKHLLLANKYTDADLLRTRLVQLYYLKEPLSQAPSFSINIDIDTILNLLDRL